MADIDINVPETIEEAIDVAARTMVKRSKEGDRETENFPPKDLIEADRYLAAKAASAKPHFGLRMTKCIPPGGG
jgi:hypothetical protein